MVAKILAIKHVDFEDDNNRPVKGDTIHFLRKVSQKELQNGVRCENNMMPDHIFVRLDEKAINSLIPGKSYDFCYDMCGGKKPELVEIKAVS